jgi:GTP pyrophosphokinase
MHSRTKHYYSLYQKIKWKDKDLDKIYDLVAMRIIVPDIKSCYEALGVIHKHYKPLPSLIKDYIALPKPNGYQSLHTTIFCEKGRVVEIQIRTESMHDYAENGIAAHWAYSESRTSSKDMTTARGKVRPVSANAREIQWVAQLKKFLEDSKTGEEDSSGLTTLKIDFFKNRIFAFTPKGDVKDLPEGATPIDFAYAIHTDLGHAVKGAKVNGKIVSLIYELKNGDVIEIIKGKEKKPSFDWLKIVKTAFARRSINSWLRESEDIRVAKFAEEKVESKRSKNIKQKTGTVVSKTGEPLIAGQHGLMYKIAKCCNPEPGQKIKGYMTLTKGVSIHTHQCSNIKNAPEARLISVSWD